MAISYPIQMPGSPGVRTARFGLVAATTVFRPELGGPETVLARQGSRWRAVFTLPPMPRADAGAWTAFFAALRGAFGTFEGYDPAARTPRGAAGGTPLVAGGSQTGNALATDGWPASTTGVLLAGDYIELDGRYHMVVEDASSDGTGAATLSIEPALRSSPPDNEPIVTANPVCVMRLAANEVGWDVSAAVHYGFSFAAIEAL